MNPYMQMALDAARAGMRGGNGGPFGAAIVNGEQILSVASNEVLSTNDPTAHAEIVAIRKACQARNTYDLSGCTLYATGEPCPMCLSAIVWANIKTVFFALSADDAEKIGFRDSMIYRHLQGKETILELQQIDTAEASKLYEEYKENGYPIY